MEDKIILRIFQEDCIPVVMATDAEYVPPLCVALSSLVRHASSNKLYDIIILCIGRAHEILVPLLPIFCRRNISVRAVDLHQVTALYTSNHISLATYNRLYIPELLRDYAKVLYMDCDTTVHADVAELYDIDIGNNYLAASEDYYLTQGFSSCVLMAQAQLREQGCPVEGHINAGILSMNLAALRQDNMQQSMLECAAAHEHLYHDQSVLNIICRGRILPLPLEWNMCVGESIGKDRMSDSHYNHMHRLLDEGKYKIVHYTTGRKPWKHLHRPLADLWWQEALHVPYAIANRLFHISFSKWLVLRSLATCVPGKIRQFAAHRVFPAFTWKP